MEEIAVVFAVVVAIEFAVAVAFVVVAVALVVAFLVVIPEGDLLFSLSQIKSTQKTVKPLNRETPRRSSRFAWCL
jgi:hypothetical protein